MNFNIIFFHLLDNNHNKMHTTNQLLHHHFCIIASHMILFITDILHYYADITNLSHSHLTLLICTFYVTIATTLHCFIDIH